MTTRDHIIRKGDELIRGRGYHAFSFSDISKELDIKNASIHYYFPTKTDLGIAIVQKHILEVNKLMALVAGKSPSVQLDAFLSIYDHTRRGNRICIVGSLASTITTVEDAMARTIKELADIIIQWLTAILYQGRMQMVFSFRSSARTRALMLASTMLASVQLSRLTGAKDFDAIRAGVVEELRYVTL